MEEKEKNKIGRPKGIKTPEKLLEYFNEYKHWCKENPILKNDFRGKDADEVHLKLERPLTMEGFETWLAEETQFAIMGLSQYFANREERYEDFVPICTYIRQVIRGDQIGGGMAGIYNPSITARLNNLSEKTETTGNQTVTVLNLGDGIDPNNEAD